MPHDRIASGRLLAPVALSPILWLFGDTNPLDRPSFAAAALAFPAFTLFAAVRTLARTSLGHGHDPIRRSQIAAVDRLKKGAPGLIPKHPFDPRRHRLVIDPQAHELADVQLLDELQPEPAAGNVKDGRVDFQTIGIEEGRRLADVNSRSTLGHYRRPRQWLFPSAFS